jgi:hypothetical protein
MLPAMVAMAWCSTLTFQMVAGSAAAVARSVSSEMVATRWSAGDARSVGWA